VIIAMVMVKVLVMVVMLVMVVVCELLCHIVTFPFSQGKLSCTRAVVSPRPFAMRAASLAL
jgi:hypothetical protein